MQRDSRSIYYLRVLELTWIRTRLCPLQSEDGEYWCRSLHRPEKLTHPNIQYVIPIDADKKQTFFCMRRLTAFFYILQDTDMTAAYPTSRAVDPDPQTFSLLDPDPHSICISRSRREIYSNKNRKNARKLVPVITASYR